MKSPLCLLARASRLARLALAEVSLQAINEAIASATAKGSPVDYLHQKRQRAQRAVEFAKSETAENSLPLESQWWGA